MSVVLAFIQDEAGRVLITQRALDSVYGGYWELPGGKIEENEAPVAALKREIEEELGLLVKQARHFATLECGLVFLLYHVQAYSGEMSLNVNQLSSTWIFKQELNAYCFPPANEQFFAAWHQYLELNHSHINHKM